MDEGNDIDSKLNSRIAKWKVKTVGLIKYREQKYSIDDSSVKGLLRPTF